MFDSLGSFSVDTKDVFQAWSVANRKNNGVRVPSWPPRNWVMLPGAMRRFVSEYHPSILQEGAS